jgi:serine/threonine-protein kinase
MTPERWQQVKNLFHAALELDASQRAAFLDEACAGDPSLRRQVEALMASHEGAPSFLEAPALEVAAQMMAQEQANSPVRQTIGPFKIVKRLGAGGMGEVYLAEDTRLGRKVALKLLAPALVADSQSRIRFLREAQLASALDHPNICTIHEIGQADGHYFISMQYVEGETLKQVIGGRPLSLESLLSISLQVADALRAAHAHGIIHRDIKSNNIIITAQGQAKVLDFGLAKLLEPEAGGAESDLTRSGAMLGTPSNMSPEQARGERVDHRSDIFSFGVLLYEMATGRTPFKRKSPAETMNAVINEPHTPVSEINKDVPPGLVAVIDRALAKESGARYQSMPEMLGDLRGVVAQAGSLRDPFDSAEVPDGVIVPYVSPRRRTWLGGLRRWTQNPTRAVALALAASVVLVGLALIIYSLWPKHPVPPAPIKSIAVLPFKPLVAESRDETLEMGMTDTLITKLSAIRQINVRPISAVRKYTGLDQDPMAAGREQRVDAVLDGSIQKSGEKIRVTVRLVRVEGGAPLWASQFDEKMTDIFAVQDSISERVAGALAVKLTSEEKQRLTKPYTANTEAYELYLKGRYHLNRLTDDGFLKSLDYFQQAIERDPNFALAHAGVAESYNALGGFNVRPPKEVYPKAKSAAVNALKLDDALAQAHTALATIKLAYDWDWSGAEREFNRAIELNPSDSEAHYQYGYYLAFVGQFDEALREIRRAQELDPVSLVKITGVAQVLFLARRYDEAMAECRKALEMDPNLGFAHWLLGLAYTQKGMYEPAILALQRSIPLSGDSLDEPASLAHAYALSGNRGEARKILDELKQQAKHKYLSPTVIAALYGALGEENQAFAWLDKAYDERDSLLIGLRVEPMFDPLRSDPRFTDLLRRVGLAP